MCVCGVGWHICLDSISELIHGRLSLCRVAESGLTAVRCGPESNLLANKPVVFVFCAHLNDSQALPVHPHAQTESFDSYEFTGAVKLGTDGREAQVRRFDFIKFRFLGLRFCAVVLTQSASATSLIAQSMMVIRSSHPVELVCRSVPPGAVLVATCPYKSLAARPHTLVSIYTMTIEFPHSHPCLSPTSPTNSPNHRHS